MQDEFGKLAACLRARARAGPVHYFANPGNWGDALIRHGTLTFFHDIGLEYQELRSAASYCRALRSGGTLVYGGGGGWCKYWNHSTVCVRLFRMRFHVVVLPSTYEKPYAIPNTTFFCRDRFESKENMLDAVFCHDMAFYIGRMSVPGGEGIGHFFRTDQESRNRKAVPPGNNDLSEEGNRFSDVGPFIEAIARFSVVRTDRLHVAIAASLLGREVHLYPGAYFKNRAVYLSSMRGRFDNVLFHEERPMSSPEWA